MKMLKIFLLRGFIVSLLGGVLSACGGGSGSNFTAITLNGIAINTSNYTAVFRNGVSDLADINNYIITAVNRFDITNLNILSNTANSVTYECLNTGGWVRVNLINTNTADMLFNNCELRYLTSFDTAVLNNRLYTSYSSQDGIVNYPFVNFDWKLVQTVSFTNLTITEDGITLILSGDAVITESNNVAGLQYQGRISSSNLVVNLTDGNNSRSIDYSSLVYNSFLNTATNVSTIDFDFLADVSPDIGAIRMTTQDAFSFDANDTLQDVFTTITTGTSSMTISGEGNNNLTVAIDSQNDGTFEESIATSWPQLNAN